MILARKVALVRTTLESVLVQNAADDSIARKLVAESAWWLTHRSGRVRRP